MNINWTLVTCPYMIMYLYEAKADASAQRPSRNTSVTDVIDLSRDVNGATTDASASLRAIPKWAALSAPLKKGLSWCVWYHRLSKQTRDGWAYQSLPPSPPYSKRRFVMMQYSSVVFIRRIERMSHLPHERDVTIFNKGRYYWNLVIRRQTSEH